MTTFVPALLLGRETKCWERRETPLTPCMPRLWDSRLQHRQQRHLVKKSPGPGGGDRLFGHAGH